MRWTLVLLCALLGAATPGWAAQPAATRRGSEIYARFREHLAEPVCADDASVRWRRHFAAAPDWMADGGRDTMPLFGYVVDALIEADLPTELALIPFVESGYKPGARSPGGPAGLWQMIAITARNHGVPIRSGYDGRLSPVDSTKAAVRYLKTLYGMFAGDWRLAAMAYNAGEYRIFGALKRSGQEARSVDLGKLAGVPQITRAYVRKLHALACVLEEADDRANWRAAIDRQVPLLTDLDLPDGVSLESWAARSGLDVAALRRMNPAFGKNRILNGRKVLAAGPPATRAQAAFLPKDEIVFERTEGSEESDDEGRVHVVRRGESASVIARHYRVGTGELLRRNGLTERSVLPVGMRLKID